jgi:glycogen debranching enzyme
VDSTVRVGRRGHRATGGSPSTPIALCEVQGYVYDAYRTRAGLARMVGEEDVAREWDDRATALKEAFNERF